ncbi:hypothetical protein BDY19DRAFT_989371 [Irpex rosettiformis]|uniref:Uncharacterized protein n=1 Tax=Irpex rosettiformis TaxID=378272 RepID=A0ACB8UHI6_9APHY|nr:hypothetical protein BDY19DRAFT_989371 [Irpex rosettiformis]
MSDSHYADAGHSRSSDASESIEMDSLEELAITPDPRRPKHEDFAHQDYENDSGEEDEALLVPQQRTTRDPAKEGHAKKVSIWVQARRIVIETGPTLLLTTVGLLFTGELLNHVSHWKAMSQVDELIMIIPVVLNLKGNLEMNLSARLGTAANIGELDGPKARRHIILGNLTLLQVQATVVSFVAALVAFGLGRAMPPPIPQDPSEVAEGMFRKSRDFLHDPRRPLPPPLPKNDPGGFREFLVTASSAMLAACMSSVILGSFMCSLVVLCRKFGLDPDNIAPPIAACLGDLVTLLLLGVASSVNIVLIRTPFPLIIIIILTVAAVGWAVVTRRNRRVSHLLWEGWVPLFAAMIISCGTGIVLDLFVSRFEGFALLAAVISGLPGNVGSIFVSRLSTALHTASYTLTGLPQVSTDDLPANSQSPPSQDHPSPRLVMITLLCVTFPIEVAFLATLRALGWLRVPFVFLAASLFFFVIAVVASLFLAQALTNLLWKRNLDPDMYALPIHSALMDLIGQLLLVVCFEILSHLGVPLKSQDSG